MSESGGNGSVRVEFDDLSGGAGPAPEAPNSGRRLLPLVLLVAAGVVAAIVFASRPEDGRTAADTPIAASSTTTEPVEPAADAPPTTASVQTSEFEGVSEWTPQNGLLTSPTPADFGWLAMEGQRSGGRLVRTTDGLSWDRVDTNLPDSALLRIRRADDGRFVALVDSTEGPDGGFALDRWTSEDAVTWERTGPGAFTGPGATFAIFETGEVTLVLAEAPSDEPIPAVSEVLSEFIDADVAAQVCAVEPNGLLNFIVYDCAGNELLRLDDVSNEVEDRIAFAGQVLRFRYAVHVSIEGGPSTTIPLPPATSLVGISPANDGFLALVIDASDAIADPVRLLTAGLFAELRHYGVDGEVRTIEDAPVEGQPFGDQLLPGIDGRVYLSQTNGLHAANPPYEDWSVVADGPNGDIPLGSEIRVLRGSDLLTFSDLNEGRIWISREGGDWQRIDVPSGVVFEAVLATEDYIVFRDFRGSRNELLRVDLAEPIGGGG
jgi:hypothetical protein